MMQHHVLIAYKSLPAYRVRFFEELQRVLARDGIVLDIVYGNPDAAYGQRGDVRSYPGGIYTRNRMLEVAGRRLIWQPILRRALRYDLVILEQANSLLVNYPLLLSQRFAGSPRVALWGHGANLQSSSPNGARERLKRWYSRLPHWWFAYTQGSAGRVRALGYDPDRISVVQNAIDTTQLRAQIDSVTDDELSAFREANGCADGATGLFMGSLYADKRLGFLIDAADRIVEHLPTFRLLIAGDGPDHAVIERAAASRTHVRFLGRLDGEQRALALRAADCMLMPGLVGLGILDAFAAQAPIITTDYPFHSPEIEYLQDGLNGMVDSGWEDPIKYADAVLWFLGDPALQETLRDGCRSSAKSYTNEEMVSRFSNGVRLALRRAA